MFSFFFAFCHMYRIAIHKQIPFVVLCYPLHHLNTICIIHRID